MSRNSRKVVGVLAIATVLGALPAVPAASTAQPSGPEFAPMMLVLDASGSMTEAASGGGTRMDAAKRAVSTVVDATPDSAQVGFTVYGTGTGSSEAEKAAGCQDVQVLKQVSTIDKAGIKNAANTVNPRGYTPIGKALQTAADALPKEGPRSIVLVSDGIDTCAPPDPCETVKTLSGQGVDLVVHTVGFGVDDAARNQLTCVAQATGGTYTDAPDPKILEQTLPRVTASAMRNYQPSGTPVDGGSRSQDAPSLVPGEYLDAIGPKDTQFYAVDAPEGATLYLSATVAFQRTSDAGTQWLKVEAYGRNGDHCGISDQEHSAATEDGEVLTAQATLDTAKDSSLPQCTGPGRYFFAVSRDSSTGQQARLPLELLVGVEPAVNRATLPGPATGTEQYVDASTPPVATVGGGTFGTAAKLPGAGHYTDQLRFGEFVFYQVRVDWGQTLNVRVRFGALPDPGRVDADAKAFVYSPFRNEIGQENFRYTGRARLVPDQPGGPRSVPTEYRNRELADDTMSRTSIAGYYYVAVKVGQNKQAQAADTVPVTVDVSITGQAHAGPQYGFTSDRQREVGVFGENASTGGGQVPQAVAGEPSTGSFPVGWVIGGAAAVLVLIGGFAIAFGARKRHWR